MTDLKFSNAEIDYVCHLIENHMFHYTSDWTDAAIRRFLVKVGTQYVDDLIDLRLADMYIKQTGYTSKVLNVLDKAFEYFLLIGSFGVLIIGLAWIFCIKF